MMTFKVCDICEKTKKAEKFSLSYRSRCKSCYNWQKREKYLAKKVLDNNYQEDRKEVTEKSMELNKRIRKLEDILDKVDVNNLKKDLGKRVKKLESTVDSLAEAVDEQERRISDIEGMIQEFVRMKLTRKISHDKPLHLIRRK
jgi:hypothetical protein